MARGGESCSHPHPTPHPPLQVTIWRIPTDQPDSVRLLNTYWGTAAPWLNLCRFVLPLFGGAYQDRHVLLVRGRFHSSLAAQLRAGGVRWGRSADAARQRSTATCLPVLAAIAAAALEAGRARAGRA